MGKCLTDVRLTFRWHDENHEPGPTGAQQLAAERSGTQRRLIRLINSRGADPARELPLKHPTFMEEVPESVEVSAVQQA